MGDGRVLRIQAGLGNAYLVEGAGGLVAIDTGSPGAESKLLSAMARLGRTDLRLILITHAHADHYGSAAALRRITGAPIAVHSADAAAMASGRTPIRSARGRGKAMLRLLPLFERIWRAPATEPDAVVDDGDAIEVLGRGAHIVHTPGHTPGSLTVALGDGRFFVGDLLSKTRGPHAGALC